MRLIIHVYWFTNWLDKIYGNVVLQQLLNPFKTCWTKTFQIILGECCPYWYYIFLLFFKVGDPAQLPATVISDVAKNHG